jgi:hypothetical protein
LTAIDDLSRSTGAALPLGPSIGVPRHKEIHQPDALKFLTQRAARMNRACGTSDACSFG